MIIYVIGHKNPDTDSVAAAFALAHLRNLTHKGNTYVPARCGLAGKQTRFVFETAKAALPILLKDVYPKISDIMTKTVVTAHIDEAVFQAFRTVDGNRLHYIPVVDSENKLCGLVGEQELMRLFVQEAVDQRPVYHFCARHIPLVLKGHVIHIGEKEEFDAALMVGAMPKLESLARIEQAGANHTILVVGNRENIISCAVEQNIPAIIITGTKEEEIVKSGFTDFKGWVFLSGLDSAETIRRLILATPVSKVMSQSPLTIEEGDYVERASEIITKSRQRLLPVVSVEDNKLVGVVTRTNMIERHKTNLILVDHNEQGQAVDGVETANVLEIVDHHRLGAVKTNAPVSYYAKPVGSTCTLVYQLYKQAHITPNDTAGTVLLGGILSDTVLLKSPTATEDDEKAIKELAELLGLEWKNFGEAIFRATDNLSVRTAENIVSSDMKVYNEYGVAVGIAQVEAVTLTDLADIQEKLFEELIKKRSALNLDWTMLLITDIIKEESVLLSTPFEAGEKRLLYRETSPHCFSLPGILSRKKQLLPEILRILEEL